MPIVERCDIFAESEEIIRVSFGVAGSLQRQPELRAVVIGKARILPVDRPRMIGVNIVVKRLRVFAEGRAPVALGGSLRSQENRAGKQQRQPPA